MKGNGNGRVEGAAEGMLREHDRTLRSLLLASDIVVSVVVFTGIALVPTMRSADASPQEIHAVLTTLGVLACLVWPLMLNLFSVYGTHRREAVGQTLTQLFFGNLAGVIVLSAVAFALSAPVSTLFPIVFGTAQFIALATSRSVMLGTLHYLRRTGHNYRNLLIVGCGPRAARVMETLQAHPEWGMRIVGFVDDGSSNVKVCVPEDSISKFVDVPRILRDEMIDEVLVACPRTMLASISPIVQECAAIGVPITLLSDLFGDHLPPPRVSQFDSMAALTFAPVHHSEVALAVKRCVDVVGSGLGLMLSSPVLLAAAAAIRISSPGKILFYQTRLGKNGRPFRVLKLRTMCVNAESMKDELWDLNEMDGPVFKIEHDPRVTGVGAFLRKWSLDELPQLWNVMRGDMSLVGPRPPTPDEVVRYHRNDRRRLSMRPGITCIWQVSGRNEIGFNDWMKLDLLYIDTWSLGSDMRILLRTIPAVLLRKGAS